MAHGRPRITEEPPVRVTISDDEQADLVDHLLAEYRLTLQEDRRSLFDRFTEVDVVRQVVGVGSVGMQVYLVLLEGRTGADPLFLQVKQAGPSVYEAHTQPSRHDNHGARVTNGKRLVQSATDIFVGWGSLHGKDYYVRQFRDMKIIPTTELIALGSPSSLPHAARRSPGPTPAPATRWPSMATSGRAPSSPLRSAGSPACTPIRTNEITPSSSAPSPLAPSRVCPAEASVGPVPQPENAVVICVGGTGSAALISYGRPGTTGSGAEVRQGRQGWRFEQPEPGILVWHYPPPVGHDLYVSLIRTTHRLTVVYESDLPACLHRLAC